MCGSRQISPGRAAEAAGPTLGRDPPPPRDTGSRCTASLAVWYAHSTLNPTMQRLACLGLALITSLALSQTALAEVPSDRQAHKAPTERSESIEEPLLLPPAPDHASDAGRTDWANVDAAMIRRDTHLRRVAAAYGAAGTFAGFSVTSLLIADQQKNPDNQRFWRNAALGSAGIAGGALIAGTVLWAITPPAPGAPRLAAGPETGLSLVVVFN